MKKNYLSLILLLFVSIITAQNNDFNNGGGDFLWSNSANWSLGTVPVASNNVRLPLVVESLVDTDITIAKIQTAFATSGDAAVAGDSNLTIDVAANAVFGIENVSNNSVSLIFKGNLTINNSTTAGIANTLMRNQNGSNNSIIFSDGSVLNLTTPLEARTGSNNNFSFNGSLAGTAPLRVNANTISTFGATSNNTGYEGDFVWVGANASVIVNSANNNTFLPTDRKIQINAINGAIEVNGENVFKGNISINGDRSFAFDVNKNQNSMGTITFAGGTADGTLNLDIDSSITELSFADSSEVEWNMGTLNIIGYKEGVLRFGTDNTGLTAAQISQITADGVAGGQTLALETDGSLVLASSLSIEDYDYQNKGRLSFPTIVSNKNLQIKVPITSYKIFNLMGQKVQSVSSKSEFQEINVDNLKAGIYILSIEGKVSERFIKQ
ncbi:T9SS type A sorting domain-containing protein [uncultured Polaribacter sp.]|uniref:T9SS type A sorting domain-containing protein n=1 Tax=uncultured Polaribacter sp. TaxID=174711 RepID=UPI00260BB236|nr:T9SS type A sorting domain-containing protein [uncultured Polaribacter sp.]